MTRQRAFGYVVAMSSVWLAATVALAQPDAGTRRGAATVDAGSRRAGRRDAGVTRARARDAGVARARGRRDAGAPSDAAVSPSTDASAANGATAPTRRASGTTAGTAPAGTNSQRTTGSQTAGSQTAGSQTAGSQTAGSQTAGSQTAGSQTAGSQTAGSQSAGSQTAGSQTAGSQTAGSQTAGSQTAGSQTAGSQTAGSQTAGSQTAGARANGALGTTGSTSAPPNATTPTGTPAQQIAPAAEDEEEEWTEEDEAWAEDAERVEPVEPAEPDESTEPTESTPSDDAPTDEDESPPSDENVLEGQAEGLPPAGATVRYTPPLVEPAPGDMTFVLPPFLYGREGGVTSTALFPLFYLRESPGTTELTIPPYYLMRGPQNWDVLFPLFWWYRGANHHTWAVPLLWHHEAPDGFDFGLAPFVMTGRHDDHHYTLIPPLLTLDWGSEHERFTFAANFWRIQERYVEHYGLFPFLWVENHDAGGYTLLPPFFFRFEDRDEGTALTIVPPFYHRDEPNGSYFGIPPLFHHSGGPDHHSTTIFPLLSHFSEEPDVMRLVAGGLFWYWRDHGDETIVTPLYQRFRGATELDAVAPFFFSVRDPRDGSSALAVPPLVWHFENPGAVHSVVFPFFARFEERGRNTTWITPLVANHQNHETRDETTWVFPNLQVSRWHDGDAVNLHPLFYFESTRSHQHSVVAPIWFDFESFEGDRNRYSVVFPFFWRFREGNTTSTLVLNLYHRERVRSDASSEWEFHFFPFFSYGENSLGGHWWKIFYGLAGYERRGPYGITTLFYVPFQTDGPALRE